MTGYNEGERERENEEEISDLPFKVASEVILPTDEIDFTYGRRMTYLHPAADSLSAYILPMSPMPMRPMTKSSISGGRGMTSRLKGIVCCGKYRMILCSLLN